MNKEKQYNVGDLFQRRRRSTPPEQTISGILIEIDYSLADTYVIAWYEKDKKIEIRYYSKLTIDDRISSDFFNWKHHPA